MIKYVVLPESKKTVGFLEGTQFDAYRKIEKMLTGTGFCFVGSDKYLMPNKFTATTTCNDEDVYSEEEGKRIVKRKLLSHYHKSLNKRMGMFANDLSKLNSNALQVSLTLRSE